MAPPPKGNVLTQNEYRNHPSLRRMLSQASKRGKGHGVPEFVLVNEATIEPIAIIEAKARVAELDLAVSEATGYANHCVAEGYRTFAIGLAGTSEESFKLRVLKSVRGQWRPVTYGQEPIGWIPNRDDLFGMAPESAPEEIKPTVPPPDVLAARADEINRLLREAGIKDEFRPAVVAASMLAIWQSKGDIRRTPGNILVDINDACGRAFWHTRNRELCNSIRVDTANVKLQEKARRILSILERLNVAALTAEHDYLGQLYETFFHYTGGNTIGQYFTPRHVADFMAELVNVGRQDTVLDPACGTGGFLVAAMNHISKVEHLSKTEVVSLVASNLIGFDSEPVTASLAVANMILRGDGSTGIYHDDCFTSKAYPVNRADVVMMNPPFPHKKTDTSTEEFVERAMEGLRRGGRAAIIVPMSRLVKSECKAWRDQLRAKHTVDAVIWLSDELFEPYASAYTAVLVMTKGIPHPEKKATFFAKITNDGFRISKSFRKPADGDETPEVLTAFRQMTVKAGLTGVAVIPKGGEWGPGAYIPARVIDDAQLLDGVGEVIRNKASAIVRFAPQIRAAIDAAESPDATVTPYRDRNRSKSERYKTDAGTIGAAFEIHYGQRQLHSKSHLAPGSSIVISSGGTDNGIYGFFAFDDLIKPPFATVPSTGTIGQAAVQTVPCGVTDDCLLLLPRPGVPVEALYIASAVIRHESWRFNYGRKITPARIAGFPLPLHSDTIYRVREHLRAAKAIEDQALAAVSAPLDAWDSRSAAERADDLAKMYERWDRDPMSQEESAVLEEVLADIQRERDA